ncbi:hypothetical protein M5E86_17780 [Blautia wexlerae]|nr:hypothetical protein M5E86_17780 [Blautia wexlerae]
MGRQSDQVERATLRQWEINKFLSDQKDAENVAALKNNNWSLQRSIHEMQKYFVKNFPEYLDRE